MAHKEDVLESKKLLGAKWDGAMAQVSRDQYWAEQFDCFDQDRNEVLDVSELKAAMDSLIPANSSYSLGVQSQDSQLARELFSVWGSEREGQVAPLAINCV